MRFPETQIRNVTESGLYFSLFTKEFGQERGKIEAQRQILSPTDREPGSFTLHVQLGLGWDVFQNGWDGWMGSRSGL